MLPYSLCPFSGTNEFSQPSLSFWRCFRQRNNDAGDDMSEFNFSISRRLMRAGFLSARVFAGLKRLSFAGTNNSNNLKVKFSFWRLILVMTKQRNYIYSQYKVNRTSAPLIRFESFFKN